MKYCLVLVFLCLLGEVKLVENTFLACDITFSGDDKVNVRNINSHTKNTHTHHKNALLRFNEKKSKRLRVTFFVLNIKYVLALKDSCKQSFEA